jgi:hypothetical protein
MEDGVMTKNAFKSASRWLLTIFGLGAAGTAVNLTATDQVFAKQFLDKGADMLVPPMVYDPELQVMVDPATRIPIYSKNKDMKLAKVTAGCSDCPKYDA